MAEREAILTANQELKTRSREIFGVKLEAAEKRMRELDREMHHAKMHCIELEEKIK